MTHRQELSARLAAHVRSTDSVPADAIDRAQARLGARLQQARRPVRASLRVGWAVTATAVLAAVLMIAGPMISGGGDAFAAVQAHFRQFTTLSMTIAQRMNGQALQNTRTRIDARGIVRTDVGEQLSVIVDAPRGRLLTLLHEPRQAVIATIPKQDAGIGTGDALQWLEDLRTFKGKATPLPDSRVIDGHNARGWTLDVGGSTLELWADGDGLPLAMRQHGSGGLEIDFRFEFDQPIPPELLSSDPPLGYTSVAPDED